MERRRKDGTTGYTAQVLIKQKGIIVFREAKTFDKRREAVAWIGWRETELRKPGALASATERTYTLTDAIDRYVEDSEKDIGRTKAQVLKSIKSYPIADMECSIIGSEHIVAFAKKLAAGDRKPQTVSNYVSHLAAIFAVARPAWGMPLNQQAMSDAQVVLRRLGTTSKSTKRDRRPTLEELDKLMTHFGQRQERTPHSVPMQKVIPFAIFSTRRLEEITRIAWADLEEKHSRILVRDMKHPGQKSGNDVYVDLPAEALAVIKTMPQTKPEIFPYSTDAIGAAFTRACRLLSIEDLHFHDLRHEGVSRLFELGLNIPHVAAVSGHRSWSSLQRYTQIRQRGDKFEGWRWLEKLV